MKIALYLAFGLLAIGFVLGLRIAAQSFWDERSDYVRVKSTDLSLHPERADVPGLAAVDLTGAQGARLAGWYVPSRDRAAVILVHGTGAEHSSLVFETRFLAQAGYGVLALDLPGQGASDGRTRWGVPERRAISLAVDWLSSRPDVDPRRIGGLGLSMGAYVLTQAAVLDPRLRAVVLAAPPNDVVEQNWNAAREFGLLTQIPNYLALRAYGQSLDMPPKDVIGRIAPRPLLLIAGELDPLVPSSMTDQLYAAAKLPKELWIVPGAHHVDYARIAGPAYRTRVIDFFNRTLAD